MAENSRFKRQQGVALITVLLVVALVVIIASSMTGRLQLIANRTINQQLYQQGLWSGLAGEQLALKVLNQDFKDDPNKVHLQQLWSQQGMIFPLENGQLSGQIQDLRSCFNLNALAAEPDPTKPFSPTPVQRQFEALLRSIEIEEYLVEKLSSTVRDWVDKNDKVESSIGAEDDSYASMQVPYLTPNSSMATVTELLAIDGMTPALYRQIRPYVCVIPNDNDLTFNVNTIDVEQPALLVAAFGDAFKLSLSDASSVLSSRKEDGFSDKDEFFATSEISKLGKLSADFKKQFKVTSDSFRAVMEFTIDKRTFTLESKLHRDDKGKLMVVSRQFGDIE
ncbi:MAG: type II secretion system minor pseudopilin GspK [Gammaproteobacteria bacterium]|nr:type II secretion system minor pseudopilin GspK [Gammaproteobacteria bacterium]